MSGLKKCHFDAAVGRLKENIARFAELSNVASARFINLAAKNSSGEGLSAIRQELGNVSLSDIAKKFAADECRQFWAEIQKARDRAAAIEKQFGQADIAMRKAMDSRDEMEKVVDGVKEKLAELTLEAQRQVKTMDYIYIRLDKEVHAVEKLSDDLKDGTSKTGTMLAAAYDQWVNAHANLVALAKTVRQLTHSASHIETLAEKRNEAHKIQEEQKRAAVQSSEEIAILLENIEKAEHERFMPKAFEKVRQPVQAFEADFKREDYKHCSETGPDLVERLKAFFEELSSLIQAFHEAEQVTRSQLQAAQDELASLDLKEIRHWSQKEDEIQKVVAQLEDCEHQIDEISEKGNRAAEFDMPLQQITAAITTLRTLVNEATNNHARYDARNGIRKAIHNALKELNYDKPRYYFQKKISDNESDELSDLTIYVHNPAKTGNLRLTVNLDGDASLEVFREDAAGNELEVTQQDTVTCHNAVLELGRRLEMEGIHMDITDWGKAKDLPKATEQERITSNNSNPDRQEKSGQLERKPAGEKQQAMAKQQIMVKQQENGRK